MNPFESITTFDCKDAANISPENLPYGAVARFYNSQFDKIKPGTENAVVINLLNGHKSMDCQNYLKRYIDSVRIKNERPGIKAMSKTVDGELWVALYYPVREEKRFGPDGSKMSYGEKAKYYADQFDEIEINGEPKRIKLLNNHTRHDCKNYFRKYIASAKNKEIMTNVDHKYSVVDGDLYISLVEI